ncbi:hypothetical protein BBJ28_00013190 [Nothophytophthora sp. Chile5]|nr:hypothetical protein BBJ28_00013190 [Nothophytophthora sp. Chile5]
MGVARWRPASEESGSQVVVIEHFGVLEAKRRQGYGKQFLQTIVEVGDSGDVCALWCTVLIDSWLFCSIAEQDIHETFASESTRPQALVAYVPQTDSFASMKLFQSLGFQPAAQVQMVEDSSFLRMRMAWGCDRS